MKIALDWIADYLAPTPAPAAAADALNGRKFDFCERRAIIRGGGFRNQLRTQARNLMSDRVEAARLMREEPNMTLEELVRHKSQNKGLVGDAIWQDILDSSQKSRSSVNKALGLE